MESNMHADELRMAVTKVVDILNEADIRAVVDQYRAAKGDQRTAAAARLGHAGAVLMESIDALSAPERQVVKCLHLESLGSAEYWQDLLGDTDDPRKHQAEIVRLASRVMFASSHLPGLVSLMHTVTPAAVQGVEQEPLEVGEGRLCIRLTDAGERASDPDRVARAIDGIDMLYSACASIARKPAMDLRLDSIVGKRNRDRDLQFTGERDSITAVYAVIDSIPAALADIDPDQDIDLDAVVQSLPIFEDLNTLATLGTFSKKDLKDISDTMHQGALLALESGVILVDPQVMAAGDRQSRRTPATPAAVQEHHTLTDQPAATMGADNHSAAERDEHYDRYLREREAMLQQQSTAGSLNGHAIPTLNVPQPNGALRSEDQTRRDAVDELLKSLGQSRNS
jgi:hypothetical protein